MFGGFRVFHGGSLLIMPIEIIVPRLGWSMEEGAFIAWHKNDGEFVHAGDALFSIEGDKAVQEIESIDSGILRIGADCPKPGGSIHVGDLLGHLVSAAESAIKSSPAATTTPLRASPTSSAEPVAKTPPVTPPPPVEAISTPTKTPAISPRALRVAGELGVDWSTLASTGRGGRIRERDIRAAANSNRLRAPSAGHEFHRPLPIDGAQPKAVFFGELLMRLTTRQYERFVQARELEIRYTGAEANAAVSLANFGLDAYTVSAVPANDLGQACINYLRQHGVNADHISRCGTRLGTFYLETGSPPRPSKVIYDRAGSAFSELRPGQIDWQTVLAGKQWFHWSGTAPALSPTMPAVVAEACTVAKRLGLRVSCDLNYRSKLWSAQAARKTMTSLMHHVDVLIGNEEHIQLVLGIETKPSAKNASQADRCTQTAELLRTQFDFSDVAVTMRDSNDTTEHLWQCLLVNPQGAFVSRAYPVASVDRIGAGDAFSGALIYGMLVRMSGQEAIEFAAAAGCLKHSIHGDFNLVSRDEVLALTQGESGHRVQR